MSDYISRQETIESINYITNDANCPLFIAAALFQVVSEIPAADVRPVVRGRWLWKGPDKGFECSLCHSRCLLNYESDWHKSDFCPHCGADMRKGEIDNGVKNK